MQLAATWLSLAKRRELIDQAGNATSSDGVTMAKIVALTDKVVALMPDKHRQPMTESANPNADRTMAELRLVSS